MDSYLVCCLCNFDAQTEDGLEEHIDSAHSDIFRDAMNPPQEIKQEPLPPVQPQVYQANVPAPSDLYRAAAQVQPAAYQSPVLVQATSSQSYLDVTPQRDELYYQQPYFSEQSSLSNHQSIVPAQVATYPKPVSEVTSKCPHCPYSNVRYNILQNHVAKKHASKLSESLPNSSSSVAQPAKNPRKRNSLPTDFSAQNVNHMSAKRGRKSGIEYNIKDESHDKMEEKHSLVPSVNYVVHQNVNHDMGSNSDAPTETIPDCTEAETTTEVKTEEPSSFIKQEILNQEVGLKQTPKIDPSNCKEVYPEIFILKDEMVSFKEEVKQHKLHMMLEIKAERDNIAALKQNMESELLTVKANLAAEKQSIISDHQSEIANYKQQVSKLQEEVSSLEQTRIESQQIQSTLQHQTEQNSQLGQQLDDVKFKFRQLEQYRCNKIDKLRKELEDVKSANGQYELRLLDVNTKYEEKERQFNNVALNLSNMELNCNNLKREISEKTFELNQANDKLFALSDNIKSKIAAMSQMKLSQERLMFEINKISTQLTDYQGESSNFEAIKSALQDVFQNDDSFCKTISDAEDFKKMSNDEICQTAVYMLKDYMASKNKQMEDLKVALIKLNDFKNNSSFLDRKLKSLNAAVIAKDEVIQDLSTKCARLEENGSIKVASILAAVNQKNKKIIEQETEIKNKKAFESRLQLEITKLKANNGKVDLKSAETIRELKLREADFINKISKLQERLQNQDDLIVTLEKVPENKTKGKASSKTKVLEAEVMKLKEELKKQEKEHNERVKLFIKNLDSMKKQVSAAMANKDSVLTKMKNQFESKQVVFLQMRKELDSKSARIKNLETILSKNGLNQKSIF